MSFSGGKTAKVIKCTSLVLALTILIAPGAYAAKASFDMPACDRMTSETAVADPAADSGADSIEALPIQLTGDEQAVTSKSAKKKKAAVDGQTAKSGKKAKAEEKAAFKGNKKSHSGEQQGDVHVQVGSADLLSPLKLTDDSVKVGKDGKVKLQVERNVKTADSPVGESSTVMSNEAKLNSRLLKQAKKENIAPLALIESQGEAQQKLDIIGEADKQQLTDLWSATINRSPDVQFVINRMQPHSDPNHATSTVIKLLSGVLFSAVQAVPMMMGPGVGTMVAYGGIGSGGNMLQQLIYGNDQKNQKKQQISQEQATMLYKMVRDTADKLVVEFRNYKKCRSQFERAAKLLDDIKTMVAAARDSQDAAKQIDMEYTIRKAQHDLDDITDDARLHRQQLGDLAGADAVAKLDEQIDEEVAALNNATGGDAMAAQPADSPHAAAGNSQPSPAAAVKPGAVDAPKQLAGRAQPKTN